MTFLVAVFLLTGVGCVCGNPIMVTLYIRSSDMFASLAFSRVHIATTAVLIHQMPVEFVKKPEKWNYAPVSIGEGRGGGGGGGGGREGDGGGERK